ncbi:Acyl-CoA dehydrogenase family member 11 [Lentibacillus sp. JNUCC-1]|uniref:acyl-CoA dehydrogenase family protein n=1 Tax=Lentibacillus sp. JNUCC-1 TaxID=2654513 RepID=UPI0012E87419|nr:acyl-CoA dehydrogenase family protein [Lentibacillus sp. JNUCC-1]MUV36891.1 Acyl-CoA dehydrogenase family member 11 [Lentibacillus sp. JNUCC-1]
MEHFYKRDQNLRELLQRALPATFFQWVDRELEAFSSRCTGAIDARAAHTDRAGQPQLIRYDKMGNEISKVWLNEGYRQTVAETYGAGIVGYIHKEIPELGHKGNYVYAFAQGYLLSHAEPGFYCPVTLSKATAYLLDQYAEGDVRTRFLPHVLATGDTELYEGATFLTERQGGSDVGANETEAIRSGDSYRLTGEKYFASNAGACGVAMVLARMEDSPSGTRGLSLFAVPWEENRAAGTLRIRRLKDKLGVRAVPSAEVEFTGATGYLVGEPEKGFYYMMEALNLSRVSNAVASHGIMRRALFEAYDYAGERDAFGQKLTRFPMVQTTLARLAAKQNVSLKVLFEVIEMMDRVMGPDTKASASQEGTLLFRLFVAIVKKDTAEQAIHFARESLEMHGGNGYIEDFVTPRLLRDAQVLTVWEGTANILGLEVLRLIMKYHVDELFTNVMIERLDAVEPKLEHMPDQEQWKRHLEAIRSRLAEVNTHISTLKKADHDIQTYYAKTIAEQYSDLFESLVALEAAATGEETQRQLSAVYLENTMGQPNQWSMAPVELEAFWAVEASLTGERDVASVHES